jgi:lipid-A-disaccharide synthase
LINNKKYRIFICATEQSGDNIGSSIISELLKKNYNIIFDGVGGNKMSPYLTNQYFSIKDFNSMGIIEILFSLTKYIKMIKLLTKRILQNHYHLVITIDSPDFNYPLIKKLRKKQYKQKIIHVVAPSVWAWRSGRAKKFSKIYDELLVLFKFEIKYFDKFNLKTSFIGHPIYYINKNSKNIDNNSMIAFLPGSRLSELNKLFPYFHTAYEYLLEFHPDIDIFIPTLPHLKKFIDNFVKNWKIKPIISIDPKKIEEIYANCNKALVCSGTASLEIAKRNIPQLVIYKLNFITEILAKNFINVKYASIINIINNKMIIPEITNSKLNKKILLTQFIKLMSDNHSNNIQIKNINNTLKNINLEQPPYTLAADRIASYL